MLGPNCSVANPMSLLLLLVFSMRPHNDVVTTGVNLHGLQATCNSIDGPPSTCYTLTGNLGDNTSEQELRVLMGSQPGYRCVWTVLGVLLVWVGGVLSSCVMISVEGDRLALLERTRLTWARWYRTVLGCVSVLSKLQSDSH